MYPQDDEDSTVSELRAFVQQLEARVSNIAKEEAELDAMHQKTMRRLEIARQCLNTTRSLLGQVTGQKEPMPDTDSPKLSMYHPGRS